MAHNPTRPHQDIAIKIAFVLFIGTLPYQHQVNSAAVSPRFNSYYTSNNNNQSLANTAKQRQYNHKAVQPTIERYSLNRPKQIAVGNSDDSAAPQSSVSTDQVQARSKATIRPKSWCRQFDDSTDCINNGCCLANYTVGMKTMRGSRQIAVSECVSKIRENHFCVKESSPIRHAIDYLAKSSSGQSVAGRVFAYLQCPCQDGLECLTDNMEASISICRKPNVPFNLLPDDYYYDY